MLSQSQFSISIQHSKIHHKPIARLHRISNPRHHHKLVHLPNFSMTNPVTNAKFIPPIFDNAKCYRWPNTAFPRWLQHSISCIPSSRGLGLSYVSRLYMLKVEHRVVAPGCSLVLPCLLSREHSPHSPYTPGLGWVYFSGGLLEAAASLYLLLNYCTAARSRAHCY